MTTNKKEEAIETKEPEIVPPVPIEEEPKQSKKKTRKNNKKNNNLKTLVELVEASSIKKTSIVMDLSRENLLEQYYNEVEAKRKGHRIEPTISEAEFNRIVK